MYAILLTPFQKEVLVGTLLGDASLERAKPTHNTRLRFDQTYPDHAPYLNELYNIFKDLTGTGPRVHVRKPDKRTGKVYSTIAFKTLRHPSLNQFQELFYKNGIKRVPINIAELLTPIGLAFWIMDDGYITHYGETILCTQSFSLDEVKLLQNTLLSNFKLRTRLIEKKKDQWLIAIPLRQIVKLHSIVGHYMHESMLYKIKK